MNCNITVKYLLLTLAFQKQDFINVLRIMTSDLLLCAINIKNASLWSYDEALAMKILVPQCCSFSCSQISCL